MLRAGSPLAEVGQVLRHRSALTTAIYAKVDRDALAVLARPWPVDAAGGCVVTGPLRDGLADYLALRRALGYRLARPEKLLGQFLDHLEQAGEATITVAAALDWARQPANGALELVGLPAVGGARLRHLPARPGPGASRCRPRTCCRSGRSGPARTCTPTPRSPR